MSSDTTKKPTASTRAEEAVSRAEEPVTLESLVNILRERGMLETTFIEVLPRPDAPATRVH